jgi:hypothetical protein
VLEGRRVAAGARRRQIGDRPAQQRAAVSGVGGGGVVAGDQVGEGMQSTSRKMSSSAPRCSAAWAPVLRAVVIGSEPIASLPATTCTGRARRG